MTNSLALRYLHNVFIARRITYLVFYVTSRCNAACSYCLRDSMPNVSETSKNTELTIDEIDKIASRMHGLAHVLISGGEPFMRDDLDKIIHSFYMRSHTRLISISTNGYFSAETEDIVGRLLREHRDLFLQIHISINGVQDVHDSSKGLPLSFAHLKETCSKLKKLRLANSNLRLGSITVINDTLKGNMAELLSFLENDLPFFDIYYLTPMVQRNGLPISNPLLPKDAEVWSRLEKRKRISVQRFWDAYSYCTLLRSHRLINRSMKKGAAVVECTAGRKLVTLREDGVVLPCPFKTPDALGNVRDFQYDIAELLKSSRAHRIIDDIIGKKCYCCWSCSMNINLISDLKGCATILLDTVLYKLGLLPAPDTYIHTR